MNRLNFILLGILLFAGACNTANQEKFETKTAKDSNGYSYEYVTNDPLNARIYTLENGLKVYLSAYKDEPRIQVYSPVRAGGAYDPASNTGLAHYLEHIMFKGTSQFGTMDWEAESVYLDSIESMFNTYATLNDDSERKEYYQLIDNVSNEASKYAIANEYDKMIDMLGGKRLNAWTWYDETVYTVDIPANEIERFLALEGARFREITPRLFHTELEAVYEEKNRTLDSDFRKAFYAVMENMFTKHPYGTQTVIGTVDHLKNPSITEIKNYFNKYYVPNNVAICMSGDIDLEETIQLIDKYYGDWEPVELEKPQHPAEDPITEPIVKEVYGPDAEFLQMGFRAGGITTDDYPKLIMVDMILNNSEAGLIDLNLVQQQKVLGAGCSPQALKDYSVHLFNGRPKEGQSLEEVKDLILAQIELVKKGEFEDWLMPAVINDLKQSEMSQLESNAARGNKMVEAFINGIDWKDEISLMEQLEALTKEEVVAFANKTYGENYVVAYKRNGEDPNKMRVEKPSITKVELNRGAKSEFQVQIASMDVPPLKPVFVDYEKDISRGALANNIEVLSNQNNENELFSLYYLADVGSNNDPKLKIAVQYLEFLGTEEYSAEDFKKELYKLGCSFGVSASEDRTFIYLSGLDENMEAALKLFESLLNNPQPDNDALAKFIDNQLKNREDAKKNKGLILRTGLFTYGQYGPKNAFTNVLSNEELQNLTAEELTDIIKLIPVTEHRVLYYGPRQNSEIVTVLNDNHIVPDQLNPLPELVEFKQLPTDDPKVFWTHYDMVQTEIMFFSKLDRYSPDLAADISMFNQYFGGSMGSVVFQEIRESQGLAYSAFSRVAQASKEDKDNIIYAYIGTQSDKQSDAMKAMMEIMTNMPESEESFQLAKQSMLSKMESERITKDDVLWNYESARRKGLDYDIRKKVYESVQNMTLEDLKSFHESYLKNRGYGTVLVGSRDKIDFNDLKKYGEVRELTLEEIFGYGDIERVNLEMD